MNISIRHEREHHANVYTGGECAIAELTISVDQNLLYIEQQLLVIHAIVENFNRSMPHDKVEELMNFIETALVKLEALNKEAE